jgi:preprotein translocase subunit SecE
LQKKEHSFIITLQIKGLSGPFKKVKIMTNPIQFIREVRSELAKVVWPGRPQIVRTTLAVILLSLVVAAFLGAVDYGLTELIEYGVNR